MALLGHVTSTAVSGGDSPVFEKAGVEAVLAVSKKQDVVQEQLSAQAKQIADLTGLLGQFLDQQTAKVPEVEVTEEIIEEPVDLTPAEKAAATRAANKAKAEAEATKEVE